MAAMTTSSASGSRRLSSLAAESPARCSQRRWKWLRTTPSPPLVGVEVVAAHVVFDDDDDENDDEFSSSSLFSYSQHEDAYCLFLGSHSGYDRWGCARRVPLSRALTATSLFFAAASAVAAFNALVAVSEDADGGDEPAASESDGGEDEGSDEEVTLLIKPALWALDSKA